MRIDQLIEQLQYHRELYGNLQVCVDTPTLLPEVTIATVVTPSTADAELETIIVLHTEDDLMVMEEDQ